MGRLKNIASDIAKNKAYWIMILPTIIWFVILCYIPMVGVYYAFTDYDFSKGLFGSTFVGLKNFAFLFSGKSPIIWMLTKNTIIYNLEFMIIGLITQVAVAVIINELPGKIFKQLCQSLMFLPYFVSWVIGGVFIYNIFNTDYGVANSLIKQLGGHAVNFYSIPGAWKYILNGASIWKGIGYGTVMYLAALTAIDKSMYEASDLDGANIFQRIWYITLPSIRPTIVILILFSLGNIVRGQFDMFYNIIGNNGMLYNATDIIDTYVYRSLTVNFNLGAGTAAGLYQSIFGLVLILIVNKIVKKLEPDYALF